MMTESRIAVLGSTSFSGSDFIDLMLEDPAVRVLGISRSPEDEPVMLKHLRHRNGRYSFRQLHLVNDADAAIAALAEFKPTHVVNFAALGEMPSSFLHPVEYFETNTVSLVRIATALKDMSSLVKFIQISTPEVYGACLQPARGDAAQPQFTLCRLEGGRRSLSGSSAQDLRLPGDLDQDLERLRCLPAALPHYSAHDHPAQAPAQVASRRRRCRRSGRFFTFATCRMANA